MPGKSVAKSRSSRKPLKEAKAAAEKANQAGPAEEKAFHIVGIGASAGGLEALGQFLANLPEDSGMAFIVVQHLDPTHVSTMPDLLKKYARIPVVEARDGAKVQPNYVYVSPPNRNITILHGTLQLLEQPSRPGLAHSIDLFFRSLAQDLKEKAVCIVLSGTGTDGALGAKAIKAELGMVVVQDPGTAKYDGMPHAAIATGAADFVLAPEKMAGQLIEYARQSYGKPARRHRAVEKGTGELQKVLSLVRTGTKHDFSGYKVSTLNRRIERRMSVNQIDNITDYIRFLQENPAEINALFKDFLISVTGFFRDPEAFTVLKEKLKDLLRTRDEGSQFRAWVLGCSSGEEAYSMAILMEECMEEMGQYFDVQVFGTDIDSDAIAFARNGIYPTSIASDLTEERLKKFFVRKDGQYQIKKEIREKLVFAPQDFIQDPPFSRMDLLSVRNLLIYLNSDLQKKIIPTFHYALNDMGILFLGTAESIGEFTDLFDVVDSKWKIYRRRPRVGPPRAMVPEHARREPVLTPAQMVQPQRLGLSAERALLEALPAAVLVDQRFRILYVHGETARYLELSRGEPTGSILDMGRQGVKAALTSALHEASAEKREVVREGVWVKYNGYTQMVRIRVKPVTEEGQRQGQLIVIFQDVEETRGGRRKGGASQLDVRVKELEQELQFTRESLRSAIEELETANEELRSANEEYQSTNEELQSTNEELETSQEELQSVNEELMTVNTEYQKKIEDLYSINDDMKNLLNSSSMATIFLDSNLRIKRYTPAIVGIFNLIESDIGRPVDHVTSGLKLDSLAQESRKVLDTLIPVARELQSRDGQWYSMRINPYRTGDNAIAGLVLTFTDITELKQLREKMKGAG